MWADLRIWKLSTTIRRSTVQRRNGLSFMAAVFTSTLQYHPCKSCWQLLCILCFSSSKRINLYTRCSGWFVLLNNCFELFVWRNPDWEVLWRLTIRRLKLGVSMAGGKVSSSLVLATHLVVFSVRGLDVDFGTISKGYVYGVLWSGIFTWLGCSTPLLVRWWHVLNHSMGRVISCT